MAERVKKPWGFYQTLYKADNWWVKLLYIKPNEALSLQSHDGREEQWTVMEGYGLITHAKYKFSAKPFTHIKLKKKKKRKQR